MSASSVNACFRCSDAWIDGAFAQLLDWEPKAQPRTFDARAQPWMAAFLVHDSFNGVDDYLENVARFRRLAASGRLGRSLEATHRAASFRELKKSLEALTGLSAFAHLGGMRINTANPFSRGFLPPHPNQAQRAMRCLIERRRELSATGRLSIGGALASYIVFLTIHLLSDGNGRSARMMFAADCLATVPEISAQRIMGLVMLHQQRGTSFHLAVACARAGDMSMIATCFECAVVDSGPLLEQLAIALAWEEGGTAGQLPPHPIRELHRMIEMRLGFSPSAEAGGRHAAPRAARDA